MHAPCADPNPPKPPPRNPTRWIRPRIRPPPTRLQRPQQPTFRPHHRLAISPHCFPAVRCGRKTGRSTASDTSVGSSRLDAARLAKHDACTCRLFSSSSSTATHLADAGHVCTAGPPFFSSSHATVGPYHSRPPRPTTGYTVRRFSYPSLTRIVLCQPRVHHVRPPASPTCLV